MSVNQVDEVVGIVTDHVFGRPKKEKPGGGNAGSDFVVIGVYGFKYAAWLSFMPLESGESFCFSCTANVLFFFFYFLVLRLRSKFNRSLCEFASISVGLRTHSSLGRDDSTVARGMPRRNLFFESAY
jgi:hypothetical protein